jgi:hypothetical protein
MFRTENEVRQYNAGMIRIRNFKNCVHLTVIYVSDHISKPWEPCCKRDSFEGLNRNPSNYRCPSDCLLFEDKEVVQKTQQVSKHRESRRASRRSFWRSVRGVLDWFAHLPATQALILLGLVLLPLFYFSPRLAQSIKEVVNLLRGK